MLPNLWAGEQLVGLIFAEKEGRYLLTFVYLALYDNSLILFITQNILNI